MTSLSLSSLYLLFDKHAPLKEIRVKHFPAPWLTPELKKIMAKRDRAKIELRRDHSAVNQEKYTELRNRCNRMCRAARRDHIHSSIDNCPPEKMWRFLKGLGVGKSQASTNSNLDLNGLNKHFCSVSDPIDPLAKKHSLAHLAGVAPVDCPQFDLPRITVDDVIKIIGSLGSKAVGNDGISLNMILIIRNEIAPILADIINCSISTGVFPTLWKDSYIIPLPKNPNPTQFSQFRPISILPLLSKVLEHFVNQHLSNHLQSSNLLSQHQSGFRRGHSTV